MLAHGDFAFHFSSHFSILRMLVAYDSLLLNGIEYSNFLLKSTREWICMAPTLGSDPKLVRIGLSCAQAYPRQFGFAIRTNEVRIKERSRMATFEHTDPI